MHLFLCLCLILVENTQTILPALPFQRLRAQTNAHTQLFFTRCRSVCRLLPVQPQWGFTLSIRPDVISDIDGSDNVRVCKPWQTGVPRSSMKLSDDPRSRGPEETPHPPTHTHTAPLCGSPMESNRDNVIQQQHRPLLPAIFTGMFITGHFLEHPLQHTHTQTQTYTQLKKKRTQHLPGERLAEKCACVNGGFHLSMRYKTT